MADQAAVDRLVEALEEIAAQKIRGEFDDDEWGDDDGGPDWEDGYTSCVETARQALTEYRKDKGEG